MSYEIDDLCLFYEYFIGECSQEYRLAAQPTVTDDLLIAYDLIELTM